MKYKYSIFILYFFISTSLFSKSPILFYYGDNVSDKYLNQFKNIVLEPDNYDSVSSIKAFKYGYLSIGEIAKNKGYFKFAERNKLLTGESKNWEGSYFVSLKSHKWQHFVINFLIPSILKKGFNGIFLDTVDSLLCHNKKKSVIEFINSIKRRYPYIKIMMNRGFDILEKVKIDAILFESTITGYDFKNKKFYFVKKPMSIKKIPSNVEKFSVDYWKLTDVGTVKKIYRKALRMGYKPFVSEIKLQKVPNLLYDEDLKTFIIFSKITEINFSSDN